MKYGTFQGLFIICKCGAWIWIWVLKVSNRAKSGPNRAKSGPNRAKSGPNRAKSGPDRVRTRSGPPKSGPNRVRTRSGPPKSSPDRSQSSPDQVRTTQIGRFLSVLVRLISYSILYISLSPPLVTFSLLVI